MRFLFLVIFNIMLISFISQNFKTPVDTSNSTQISTNPSNYNFAIRKSPMPPRSEYHRTWMTLINSNPCEALSFLPSPYDLDDRNLFDQNKLWVDSFENRIMCIEMDIIEAWAEKEKVNLTRILPLLNTLIGPNPLVINGYFEDITVTQGETLRLNLAAGVLTRGLNAEGIVLTNTITGDVKELTNITPPGFIIRESCKRYFRDGCDYSKQWNLPTEDLEAGAYQLAFTNSEGNIISSQFNFFVNERNPEGRVITVQIPTFTMQSYNNVGGASLYSHAINTEAYQSRLIETQLYQVSLNRPYSKNLKEHHTYKVFGDLLPLLTEYGYTLHYADDLDLHQNIDALKDTNIWLMIGHAEYWTQETSARLKDYLSKGGKVLNLSGNNYWWQTDLTNQNAISLCRCPPSRRQTTSKRFSVTNRIVDNVETLGVSYNFGGHPPDQREKHMPTFNTEAEREAFLSVRVEDANHPIFRYSDLDHKSLIPNSKNWIEVEIDGLPLDDNGQIPNDIIGSSDGRYKVFASTNISRRNGDIVNLALGVDANPTLIGGHVLTFGTVGFYNALKNPSGDGRKMLKAALEYLN